MSPTNSDVKLILELLGQVKVEVNNRFDKLENRQDAILDKVSEIDKSYVTRTELQESIRLVVDEFSRNIVPRIEQEAKWTAIEKRLNDMDKAAEERKKGFSAVNVALFSAISGAIASGLIQYITSLMAKH
jgi:hypothetical protein